MPAAWCSPTEAGPLLQSHRHFSSTHEAAKLPGVVKLKLSEATNAAACRRCNEAVVFPDVSRMK